MCERETAFFSGGVRASPRTKQRESRKGLFVYVLLISVESGTEVGRSTLGGSGKGNEVEKE